MFLKILLSLILSNLLVNSYVFSQSSISDTPIVPDSTAILELNSTNKGFLPTRMTTAQRDAIVNPANALILFNTTTECLEIYVNSEWQSIVCPSFPCTPAFLPTEATHLPSQTQIIWNWNSSSNANGYKYNTTNDYSTAIDIGADTTITQTTLTCATLYNLYVWAYNSCDTSTVLALNCVTGAGTACGLMTDFTDARDGNIYPVVSIGNQCWMAENLKFLPSVVGESTGSYIDSYFYVYDYNGTNINDAKSTSNYNTYGVLYNWSAAMAGESSSNANPSGVQGICPDGWHLPSEAEWDELRDFLIANGYNYDSTTTGNKIAKSLASDNGLLWDPYFIAGTPGYDVFLNNSTCFSATPGGKRWVHGVFGLINSDTFWWTSTHYDLDTNFAFSRQISHGSEGIYWELDEKSTGDSVRCIKD